MASNANCSQRGDRYILTSNGQCLQRGARYILASNVNCSQRGARYIRGLLFKFVDFPLCSFNTAFIPYQRRYYKEVKSR